MEEVACIILYDREKRILLQHRTKNAAKFPDYWAFFGGHLKEKETLIDALKREAHEELEFYSKKPKLIMVQEFYFRRKRVVQHVFIEYCRKKESLKLHEGQGWGWYSIEDAMGLKIVPHDIIVLKNLKRVLNKG